MADITPLQILGSGYLQKDADVSGEITGLEAEESYLCIKMGDLLPASELTTAEADETGNGSKVAWALIKTICDKVNALDSDDQPERMVLYEGSFSTNPDDTVSRTYTATFQFVTGDIADES
tara:strand:+ start:788 stop:1150 length:363 start_codon:yes stop_codon:yes gene_type:complete